MANYGFADIVSEGSALRQNEQRRESGNAFRAMSTPELAASIAATAKNYPNIPSALVLSGSLAGLNPEDDQWKLLDQQSVEYREGMWGNSGFGPVDYLSDLAQGTWGIAKTITRGGMILFEGLWEEALPRGLRTGVLMYQEPTLGFGGAYSQASASTLTRATGQFFGDPMGNIGSTLANYLNLLTPGADPFEIQTESRVNIGSGFFANSQLAGVDDLQVQQLQKQGYSEREAVLMVSADKFGSPSSALWRDGAERVQVTGSNGIKTGVSLGRLATMQVFEPGSTAYNWISGSIDAGSQIFLDPSNILTGGLAKGRLAARALDAAGTQRNKFGLVDNIRKTVFKTDAEDAWNTSIGQGFAQAMTDSKDSYHIYRSLKGARANAPSRALVEALRESDNLTKTRDILKNASGTELVQKPWNTTLTGSLLGLDTSVRGKAFMGLSDFNGMKSVNRQVREATENLMPTYGGYRPRLRQRLESNFLYEGGELRRVPGSRNGRQASRLFSQMAGRSINISDLDRGFEEVIDMARALDSSVEDMEKALQQWSALDADATFGEALQVVESLLVPYRKKLQALGVSDAVIQKQTAVYQDAETMRKYFVNRAGDTEDPGVFTMLLGDGDEVGIPLAHTLSEATTNAIPVPGRDGGRMIRRMTDYLYRSESALNQVRLAEGLDVKQSIFYDEDFNRRIIVRAADQFTGIWRNMVLLRPAWTLRVVGEEQVRAAAAGLHVINNPMKALNLSLANKNLKLGMTTRKKLLQSDLFENSLMYSDDFNAAMSMRSGSWFDSFGGAGAETWTRYAQDSEDYNKWWFREMNQLQSDEVSNYMARAITDPDVPMNLDDIKFEFREGNLTHAREKLADAGSSQRHRALLTDEGADAYIDSLFARMHLKTGGRYKTLREDGWWYNDSGDRLEFAGDADLALIRQRFSGTEYGPPSPRATRTPYGEAQPEAQKVGRQRVKARTHDEYQDLLIRSGRSEEHVQNTMRKLERETAKDDRTFKLLDADRRSVDMAEDAILPSDVITDSRVLKFEIVENGNEELIRSIGTGDFRGINFDGNITAAIERDMTKALGSYREGGDVIVPDFVKGVEDTKNSALYNNIEEKFYDSLMGKPTNRYSRSPVFFRAYWRAVDDLMTQGVIDERTATKIQQVLTDGGGIAIDGGRLKSAVSRNARMEEQIKETDLLLVKYEQEYGDLSGEAGEVVKNLQTRLARLTEGDVYDVGNFNRAMDSARDDLSGIYDDMDDAIEAATKNEAISTAERSDLIDSLQTKKREIEKKLKQLDSNRDLDIDAVDEALYKAMDEFGGDGYIGGLDPANSDAMSNRPTEMEDLIERRVKELEQQGELTRRTVSQRDVYPESGMITGERPIALTHDPVAGKKGDFPAMRHAEKAEDIAKETGQPIQYRTLKSSDDNQFGTWEIHIGETAGPGTTGEFKVVITRTKTGPLKSETLRKVKGRWRKSNQNDLDTWARQKKQGVRRTEITEQTEVLPAEVPRGPEFDIYADEIEPSGLTTMRTPEPLTAREREIAVRELGATEAQLRDVNEIPKFKDAAASRVRQEKSRAVEFDNALAGRPSQLLSISEVDKMAKATAMTTVQDLMYDLSTKSAASDMLRNIFPFAEAWWEIISTWSRLVQANPKVLQQFQKGYNAVQEDVRPFDWTDAEGNVHQGALPGAEMQVEGYEGSGFFYVDPSSQTEMFALPYLSQILSGNSAAGLGVGAAVGGGLGGLFAGAHGAGPMGAAIGAVTGAAAGFAASKAGLVPEGESVDLNFNAQGLNMAASSPLPGLGPLAAVPVSWVLNMGGEAWEPLADLALPFGDPDLDTPGDWVDSLIPPTIKKFMQAVNIGDSDAMRIRANTTMEVAAMMVRQKEGSFNTPEQMKATLDEASRRAGWLYAIRGVASFTAPTSATFEFSHQDKSGMWFATQTMSNEWNRIKEEQGGDPAAAFDEFIGMYGISPFTFLKGGTETIVPSALTERGYAWEKQNEGMFTDYPQTAYYVNPVDPLDDVFDYDAYVESLREGTRVALSPEQWAMKSNQLAANITFERFRQSADAYMVANGNGAAVTFQVNKQLYGLKEALRREHPGYGMQLAGNVQRLTLDEQLLEFERWTPEMYETEAGKGVKLWLAARSSAEARGMELGNSRNWWKTSNDWQAIQLRQELEVIAAATYTKYPEFQSVYTGVFAYELEGANSG